MKTALERRVEDEAPAQSSSAGRLETFVIGAFFIIEMIPGLHYKLSFSQDNVFNQLTWSALYLFSGVRIFAMRARAQKLAIASFPLVGFCALMFLSTLWSVDRSRTVTSSIELVGSTLIGYYLVLRFSTSKLVNILSFKFAIYAIVSFGLIVLAPGRGRDDWGSGPWSGVFPDKNTLGAAMAVAIISLLALSPRNKRQRFAQIAAGLFFVFLLMGSQSATAFSSCAVTIAVFTIIRIARSKTIPIALRVGVVASGPLLVLIAIIANITPGSILELLGRSASLTGRTDFWPYLQQAIADRPIQGYGYDAFFGSAVGNNYLSTYVAEAGGWSPFHAHNSLYQIALDGGYVAVILFSYVLLTSLIRAVRYCSIRLDASGIWPISILVFLIGSSFTETAFAMFNNDDWIFFVIAALCPLVTQPEKIDVVSVQQRLRLLSKLRQENA